MYDTTPHALGSRSLPINSVVCDRIGESLLQRFDSRFKTLPADTPPPPTFVNVMESLSVFMQPMTWPPEALVALCTWRQPVVARVCDG